MTRQKHLTLEKRRIIEKGLENGKRRTTIARLIEHDASTVFKEIKNHKFMNNRYKKRANLPLKIFDCIYMAECGNKNFCNACCERYIPSPCKRRDKTVGVCNGCDKVRTCKRQRWFYDAERAHDEYRYTLKDSREGLDITTKEAERIGSIIAPLIKNGQSLYTIVQNHPEIGVCEKTLYNYITAGVFSRNGIINLDLRLKTSRKRPKTKISIKPRENRIYLKGRTYKDFQEYIKLHPEAPVVEMDTVYNDVSNGPFIQTFEFVETDTMIAVLHKEKNAAAMVKGLRFIKDNLQEDFHTFIQIILTDRGTEFTDAEAFEKMGIKIFYCDPMQSSQKPNVENNHIMLRWILPNKKNLTELGLHSQEDLDLIFSHINSYKRKRLKGKSAIDLLKFYYGAQILKKFRLEEIDSDEILLRPELIKK